MFFFPNKPIQIYDIPALIEKLGNLDDWVLQPKWNGKRIELDCDEILRLFSREKREWFLPEWGWIKDYLPLEKPWFVDGELLRDGRIFIWDYALLAGKRVYKTQYGPRLDHLSKRCGIVSHGKTSLSVVESFHPADYERLLAMRDDPMLEGMVWKNLTATNMWGPYSTTKVSSQFKYRFAG